MPRRKSSLKRKRGDKKRRLRNLRIKRELKDTIKKFQALLSAKNFAEAKSVLIKIFSKLDKAAKKRIIHKNLSRRKKSRLAKRLLSASSSPEGTSEKKSAAK
jgi:small subunit ribosomal protein S20